MFRNPDVADALANEVAPELAAGQSVPAELDLECALARDIYDTNVDKLHLFGTKLADDLTTTYAAIRSEPQYFSLDARLVATSSHTPCPSARRMRMCAFRYGSR